MDELPNPPLSEAPATVIDFVPKRRMTRWFEPLAMVRLVLRIWSTRRMTNQRHQPDEQPEAVVDYATETDEFWFDYVADMGDAFDPTMCVAWHLGRRRLLRTDIDPRLRTDPAFAAPDPFPAAVDDHIPDVFPRGRLLLMGGDEVYPDATRARYRNQVVGPYRLAWEESELGRADESANDTTGHTSDLLALPGNHDWYGGLGPFRDAFCSGERIGGWQTKQRCSWWAGRLAHGWWVWGVDTALDGTINDAQRQYFRRVKAEMPADGRLIVCLPAPPWRLRERYIDRFDELNRFFASVGVEPEVFLSGDHHIAALHRRDQPDGRTEWHLTSGGGGAFQHPVHNLDRRIPNHHGGLPEPALDEDAPFQLLATWPSNAESREGTGAWWHLLFDRAAVSLIATLSVLQLGLMWLAGVDHRDQADNARSVVETLVDHLLPVGVVTGVALILIAVFGLARAMSATAQAVAWARLVGFVHGLVQATVFETTRLLGNLAIRQIHVRRGDVAGDGRQPGDVGLGDVETWVWLGGAAIIGSIAAIVVLGSYLRVANRQFRMHDNESYSAKHSGDNRNFTRFRISPDGTLSGYVIAFRYTGSGWVDALQAPSGPATPVPPPSASDPELINVRFQTRPSMAMTRNS